MSYKIEKLLEGFQLAEGPHWDVETQNLYFIDHINETINKYTPATKEHTSAVIGDKVSIIIPVEGEQGAFIVAFQRKLAKVTWDGVSNKISNIEILGEVEDAPETQNNKLNDGKVDPLGRLWIGTISHEHDSLKFIPEKGNLYSYEKGNGFTQHVDGITVSNGLAWNRELKKFYYIDSLAYKVFQFDYDEAQGTISNREVIFILAKHSIPGVPDGQAIDTDGNLWVAVFGGGRVIKIDPRTPETILDTIYFPAKQITSVAFGGSNLDELYVTSANIVSEDYERGTEGGILYRVTGIGVKGHAGKKVSL